LCADRRREGAVVLRSGVGLSGDGIAVNAVRLDSGDLASLSREVRRILDDGGCRDVRIFASGGLDEHALSALAAAGAPIDGYGVGTSLDVSADAPYLDCVYKLQEYAGEPRRKRSTAKATWPGRKQVYRVLDARGTMCRDVVTLEDDTQAGEALLEPVMVAGRRTGSTPSLAQSRERAAASLAALPPALKSCSDAPPYEVVVAPALERLAAEVDSRFR
jgi:nicotinate phosphoribosyltransferase